jgi:hypothetical protein
LIPVLDSTGYTLEKNRILEGKVTFNPDKLELTGPSSVVEAYEGKFPVVLNAKRSPRIFQERFP